LQVEANYRRPARYGDVLQVRCRIAEIGKVSLSFEQHIHRDSVDGELLLDSKIRVACIDAGSFKPRALPRAIVESWVGSLSA
jgi:acyl-CoA thioester hydrolase